MCAADNAAHMVQGRLRIGTADAKTTAVQRTLYRSSSPTFASQNTQVKMLNSAMTISLSKEALQRMYSVLSILDNSESEI